jgi:hypothetical protein
MSEEAVAMTKAAEIYNFVRAIPNIVILGMWG